MSTSPFLLTIFLALLGYILPTFAQEAVEGVAQQAAEAAMVCHFTLSFFLLLDSTTR